MDMNSALKAIMEYDIKKHCRVNTNEDGDRFVGIKADSKNAMVYFPIGYQLPETDNEISIAAFVTLITDRKKAIVFTSFLNY